MKEKPELMSDELFQALNMMLESPWYKWDKACDIKRPRMPWKIPRFIHMVNVTKMAIKRTLSYDFYPESYIPRIDAELIDGLWSIDVTIWGKPEEVRIV